MTTLEIVAICGLVLNLCAQVGGFVKLYSSINSRLVVLETKDGQRTANDAAIMKLTIVVAELKVVVQGLRSELSELKTQLGHR